MPKVIIHAALTRFTNDQKQFHLHIDTTAKLLSELLSDYPKLRASLIDSENKLRIGCFGIY